MTDAQPNPPDSPPKRKSSKLLLLFWLILTGVFSGLGAAVFRMPSLWGGSSSVLEYVLPLPLSWGMLHWPCLVGVGLMLATTQRNPAKWLTLLRLGCIGTLLGVAVLWFVSEALRGFPLILFVSVDAFSTWLVSAFIPVRRDVLPPPGRYQGMAFFGPSAIVLAAFVLFLVLQPRYNFTQSDTVDISATQDVVRFWFYPNRKTGDAAAQCPHLARLSRQYKTRYPRNDGERHRAIYLLESRKALRGWRDRTPWVTYEWWPDGRVRCSADPSFGLN